MLHNHNWQCKGALETVAALGGHSVVSWRCYTEPLAKIVEHRLGCTRETRHVAYIC
jgi:hypothetical protein